VSNIIYTGPAGTGKTLAAKRRAVQVLDGMAPEDPAQVSARFRALVEMGRIFAPTLHPSYSYPDWVEGYRPSTGPNGELRWKIEPGVLLQAVAACGSTVPGYAGYFIPGETITSSTGAAYDVTSVDATRVDLRRHDARRNLRSQAAEVYFKDVDRCIQNGVMPNELSYSGADATNRANRAAVAGRLNWSTTQLTNSGALRAVYEHVLTKKAAGAPTSQRIVLMVDEINRADPGRLWGEALTVLEPNKRAGQPEEQPVVLQFSRSWLTLPTELHIIGTMNSADRSIAQFDVAYRRRFDFVFVGPDASLLQPYGGVDVPALFVRVNTYLRRYLGRDRQVGHAELMVHKLNARRAEHGWSDETDGELRALTHTLRAWLVPLLRDLFANDLVRVRGALGDWGGLVESADDGLEEDNDDLWGDIDEILDDSADWWDPTSLQWDALRVRKILCPMSTAARLAALLHPPDPEGSPAGGVGA
jgi:5-methylcytosine-specific restriction protein B